MVRAKVGTVVRWYAGWVEPGGEWTGWGWRIDGTNKKTIFHRYKVIR